MSNEFIMTVGLPGSGKTTYAKKHEDYVWLSSDNLREDQGLDPDDGSVFPNMFKMSRKALQNGESVIYDATNLSRKKRLNVLDGLKKLPGRRICVLFTEPYEECVRRNLKREGTGLVPEDVLRRMLKDFTVPMYCEGFDEIKMIQTVKGVPVSEYLRQTESFDQENHHHSLSLSEHMKMAEEYFKYSPDELLKIATLYHDIGKLVTKEFKDSRGNPSSDAHYYGHENAGAYMFLSADNGLSDKDALHVAALINWHMRPYIEMKDSKREAERRLVGEEFWQDIQLLHTADVLAH